MTSVRQADRQYALDHPWSKPLFLAIIIAFVAGGFLVTILPGSNTSNEAAEWIVRLGFVVQVACVIAMAITQAIKGRSLRKAMKAVL